ncbi:MAG TPA: arginine repressor [Firmicutes bacterium]|nr:arginine repressor [Bacillota bacterium]
MKMRRQMKILEVIRNTVTETQEQLAERLREQGIDVTQATVSRDIKELRLIKVSSGDGRYRYALPEEHGSGQHVSRLRRLFRESVVGMDASGNLIVVRCLSATAPGVAEAIDRLYWPEVIGTVAGDNTVLVVVKPVDATAVVMQRLQEMAR